MEGTEGLQKLIFEAYKNRKFQLPKCKDQCVGIIEINQSTVCWDSKWISKEERTKILGFNSDDDCYMSDDDNSVRNIVLVLESPHFQEFNNDNLIAPALGKTGDNIEKHIIEILIEKPVYSQKYYSGRYNLIIMNAIQYQCSLGISPYLFRDKLFIYEWFKKRGNLEFRRRLKKYNPVMIFNFCTKGSHNRDQLAPEKSKTVINKKYIESVIGSAFDVLEKSLTDCVQREIDFYCNNINKDAVKKFSGNHPCRWTKKNISVIELK